MSDAKFMLDTDMVSFVLRGEGRAAANLTAHAPSEVCLSAMSLSELRFGADKRRSKRLHRLIDTFVATIGVVVFDSAAANAFGHLRASLESRGKPIGIFDTLIAAHALSRSLVLVTNNTKHFGQIRGLQMENWLQDAG
jgi:tRNA(fMet)-specific endonuclease VapC